MSFKENSSQESEVKAQEQFNTVVTIGKMKMLRHTQVNQR
jgi:hypothetical protein